MSPRVQSESTSHPYVNIPFITRFISSKGLLAMDIKSDFPSTRIFCYCSNPAPVNTVQSPWFILSFMSFLYTSRVSATSSLTGGLNSLKLSPFARFLNFIPPAPDSSNRHHVCWSLWSSVLNPKSHLSITLPIPKTRNPHETSSQWPF